MKPESTEDILELLDGYIVSAALGAAMELGVFWRLADRPASALEMAEALHIPLNRCQHWLELLLKLGLLESTPAGYAPTRLARATILDAQSQHFWAFHAREDRRAFASVLDLPVRLSEPKATPEPPSAAAWDEYETLQQDPVYAAGFTRMLYEIHLGLAEQLAGLLDLRGVRRLLDLGGGSGVVSLALLRKWSGLTSVVMDFGPVCQAGREIAAESGLADRVTYRAADILKDDLPTGFDLIMLCDVGEFDDALFRRIHDALGAGGRLVVVDKFAPAETTPPPSRLLGAFLGSLKSPAESIRLTTAAMVQAQLRAAGFRDFALTAVPPLDKRRWNADWSVLEALG